MSYMTLSSQQKALFQQKNSLATPIFLLSSNFRAHPTTLLLKILGGPMHGPSHHLKFWGTVPQSPLGLRPCRQTATATSYKELVLHQVGLLLKQVSNIILDMFS